MMKISSLKPIIVGQPSAIVAPLCCLLPLIVVLLGIGSGAEIVNKVNQIGFKAKVIEE